MDEEDSPVGKDDVNAGLTVLNRELIELLITRVLSVVGKG